MRGATTAVLLFAILITVQAQQPTYNFHHLTIKEGLEDGNVRCIGQDKFGYIWIGTQGALNRYDGKRVKKYTYNALDSLSPLSGRASSICSDKTGRLWLGFETGLMEFDFGRDGFRSIPFLQNERINIMRSISDSILYIGTARGLHRFNTKTLTGILCTSNSTNGSLPSNQDIADIYQKGDSLFLASNIGLLTLDTKTNLLSRITVKDFPVSSCNNVAVDNDGSIWLGSEGKTKLIRISPDQKQYKSYDQFLSDITYRQTQNITGILVAADGGIWISTFIDGLLSYNNASDSFTKHEHNKFLPSSPSSNNHYRIFQDDKQVIWLGGDVEGVDYFQPLPSLFNIIFPFTDKLDVDQRGLSLGYTQDNKGNIWMSNEHGVTMLNNKHKKRSHWNNETGKPMVLYDNVIFELFCDTYNNIWMGSRQGVSRYHPETKTLTAIPHSHLPNARYYSISADRSGKIWFGCNDSIGLYWFDPMSNTYDHIGHHPVLRQLAGIGTVTRFLEDSQGRYWIGFLRQGLAMYNPATSELRYYNTKEKMPRHLIGDRVEDIKEDKRGMIWASTHSGLMGIDPVEETSLFFSDRNGLPSSLVGPIAIDEKNRLWIGCSGWLVMLDEHRKSITRFTRSEGLPAVEFSGRPGYEHSSGTIVFPSNFGFISFQPRDYKNINPLPRFYIENYSVYDKVFFSIKEGDNNPHIHLKAEENAISFNLIALNFVSPDQTWFAYKLDGFEDNWHYTQDAKAVYTNLQGGSYTFLYKAAVGNNSWDTIPSKSVTIKLDTPFYKTYWFIGAIALIILLAVVAALSYRHRQQRNLFELKSKAQLLEKEKAVVMYESLKQQINPHFLFNSLTSLSGLIQLDQNIAGDFLNQMSGIYRYILQNSNNETVSLAEELKLVGLYEALLKTRYKKGLEIHVDIPEDFLHYKIAPVTLQNLIENAIKHNIVDRDDPLLIDIFIDDDYIVVQNNLQLKSSVTTSNKQGLQQFLNLYSYLTPKPVGIASTPTQFIVRIPLI